MARKSRSASASATAIRMDSSPSTSVPGWLSLVSIPVIAMSASVVLNTLAAPFFDMKYQAVSSEPNVWLTSSLLAWRVVELWIGWSLGLDGKINYDSPWSSAILFELLVASYCDFLYLSAD